MAPTKLFFFAFSVALIFAIVGAEADVSVEGSVAEPDSSAFKIQLDQLNSKIRILESEIREKSEEVKRKDEIVAGKEKIIQDKLVTIQSLQNDIASLQKKGSLDAEEQVGKAHARAVELQNQVDKLKGELETQNREKGNWETRVLGLEKKVNDLNSKLEDLQKINQEQRTQIQKTERALKVTEEEMVKAKFEAAVIEAELSSTRGAWLPPWLAVHYLHSKSCVETQWNKHGKPVWEKVAQKALDKKAQAGKWAEPHVETIKTEARKFSKPYIDQIAVAAKPHVDKVQVVLKPYTNKVVHSYGKFLESATTYHRQVQATVQETLKKHELTRPLATKELEWFAASALLALPIIFVARVFSAVFCDKKVNKPSRSGNNHARRKAKRSHPDKHTS
ncbi:hypothetical protein LR48_Vigan561s007400 [Vigna angularis]|uniref:Uncharacterized protein n=1 Tax=Phaseolus angularis TaxID=3914 RepID=A0A0L9TEV0_PHAAN|nr:hypothetical protein LR48_Vigan561s007400 [Vigna angularis]